MNVSIFAPKLMYNHELMVAYNIMIKASMFRGNWIYANSKFFVPVIGFLNFVKMMVNACG